MYKRVRANDSLRWVSKFTPKLKSTEINKKYHTFFAKKVPDLFEGSPVISATINRWPYLLAGSKNVVNVMESWDHPIKRPFFLNPAITFTWNKKLGQDIQAHQGLKEWDTIFPLKFRYIEDFKSYSVAELKENLTEKYKKDLSEIKDDTIMYVVSTSSRNAKAFDGELKLIRQLITFCNQHQKSLYIKPKPNGKQGEFDEFSSLQNVQIGLYGEGEQSECMLDDNYHKYRLALLKSVNLVINVYTTFALEAALVGVPILQLSLENSTTFGHFAELINNPHIKNYFLEGKPYIHYNGHPNELDQKLNSGEITTLSQSYTKAIYSWINPTLTIKESVNKIISRLDL